jgi:hypothetical protein
MEADMSSKTDKTGAILLVVFQILAELGPRIYDYVKSLQDKGDDIQKLVNKPVKFWVSFGGEEGDAIKAQRIIEEKLGD